MAESVIDFAGLDAAAATADVDAGAVETPEVDSGAPAVDSGAAKVETPTTEEGKDGAAAADGKDSGKDGAAAADGKEKVEDLPGTEKTPQEIRKVLQSIKNADPKNSAAVKQLHREFENSLAFKQVFETVQAARDAKTFIDSVGGHEGIDKMRETLSNVEAVDEKFYTSDGSVWKDLVDDLKQSGHPEALGNLAPAFLSTLKEHDSKAYYNALAGHMFEGLNEANLPGALAGLVKALENTDAAAGVTSAKQIAQNIKEWYDGLKGRVEKDKAAVADPERQKLEAERKKFQQEQMDFKTKQTEQFKTEVGGEAEKTNNRLLGTQLKGYLKMPFFKGFTRENLVPLGNSIKQELYDRLKADTAYQSQMKALWGSKTPDRAKILEYHNSKVESIAADVVKSTVTRIYPSYSKGGAAAGRIAAAVDKKTAATQQAAAATASGKPVYVATKPKWEAIDFNKDPGKLLYIAGKAYLTNGKFVTWRKPS